MFTLDPMIVIMIGTAGLVLFLGLVYWAGRQRSPSVSMNRGRSQMDIGSLSAGLLSKIRDQLQRGRKIEAIKALREAKGWDLKRAKDAVEALQAGREYEQYPDLRVQTRQDYPSPELAGEVERLLAEGKKIEAIHLVRQRTSWDLKQSKEYVEQLQGR